MKDGGASLPMPKDPDAVAPKPKPKPIDQVAAR